MNKKILILLFLISISETFFIPLISFVCGYCAGYYFYDLIRPKNSTEDIVQFFSSYNKKYGFVSSYAKKLTISDDLYSGEDLCNENEFLEKSKKKKKKKKK